MSLIIGYLTIFLCVFGGFALSGGHLAAIFQPIELLIICGAAFGAFIVGNTGASLKATLKALPSLFKGGKGGKDIFNELLGLLYSLLNKARQQGLQRVACF